MILLIAKIQLLGTDMALLVSDLIWHHLVSAVLTILKIMAMKDKDLFHF